MDTSGTPGGTSRSPVGASGTPVAASGTPVAASGTPVGTSETGGTRPVRWRDRHGRGLRGPLTPPGLPLSRSRSERFDDLVLDTVEALEPRLGNRLDGIEFAVEDIPPAAMTGGLRAGDPVPLAAAFPAGPSGTARVVVYRRPVELRGGPDTADLLAVVVAEQLAALLGTTPEDIDPDLGE